MRRFLVLLLAMAGHDAAAQQWRAGTDVPLIREAAAHRSARDADTLLARWQAQAHGILRFTTVLDHGDGPIERVIKADELRDEVYGEAPNRSKQIILAWRDTSFLPNHLVYHRDHLGIVANDFGPAIRLGQGDEVRDVIHPLSPAGLAYYQFAIDDTVTLTGPRGRVRVVVVRVRPLDVDSAGTVGTLYLDLDRAALVRFWFTFTPPSYRDHSVQDITVMLENSLQENARWLPWRQSIVIRRAEALLDFPMVSVIRADWTIDDYALGVAFPPARFAGPALDGPRQAMAGGSWTGSIASQLHQLPATDADIAAVARQASSALGGALLSGLPRTRILAHGISDFVRINRVEGVTLAFGASGSVGRDVAVEARLGYGISDHRPIGLVRIGGAAGESRWSLHGSRSVDDVGDQPVISGLANSLSTAFGEGDFGDYTLVDRVGADFGMPLGPDRLRLAVDEEWSHSVLTRFAPLTGLLPANPGLGIGEATVLRATLERRGSDGRGWTMAGEAGTGDANWLRLHASALGHIAMPVGELQLGAEVGIGTRELPGYRSFVLGGKGSLLGTPFRVIGGRRIGWSELAWSFPISLPSPDFPYSRYVRLPSRLGPFVAAGIAGGDQTGLPWRATERVEPVAGLRLDLWGPLLRIELGVALRRGTVGASFDLHPDWWPVL
jgi:hypothetical protein